MIVPKEITQDIDTGINVAWFDYYDGIKYAKEKGLKQTASTAEVMQSTHFIVCCGDVMVKVEPTDFPNIKRRIF